MGLNPSLWGPKGQSSWPVPAVLLVGPQGLPGPQGANIGPQGPQGAGATSADQVSYHHPTLDTVEKALDYLLYVSPSVSLSGGSTNEKGATVTNVTLTWSTNKTMTSRLLSSPVPIGDRDQGAGGSGSYVHSGANLTANTTYSILVSDGTNSASSSTGVSFYNRRYYGSNSNSGPLTNAQILSLSKEYCSGRACTHTYDCTGGQYIWICYPASFGTASFTVNNLPTTFLLTVQSVTNNSGYIESFNCYRSFLSQQGSGITVVVS